MFNAQLNHHHPDKRWKSFNEYLTPFFSGVLANSLRWSSSSFLFSDGSVNTKFVGVNIYANDCEIRPIYLFSFLVRNAQLIQYFAPPHIVWLDSDRTLESGRLSTDFTILGNWNKFCQIFRSESGGLPADSGQTTAAG